MTNAPYTYIFLITVAISITQQSVSDDVMSPAREYACVCFIIKARGNAAVGLVKHLRMAPLLAVPSVHRDLTLCVRPAPGLPLLSVDTSLSFSCTAMHQRWGRNGLFIDGSVGACTGTKCVCVGGGLRSAGCNGLSLS